jgi:hypothetical protein
MSTNGRGETKLTWTSMDKKMEAAWLLTASDDEEELLATLEKVVRFVKQQRGEHQAAVAELEEEIFAPLPDGEVGGGVAIPLGAARVTAEEVANLPRIKMMDPRALDGAPSDGGPPPSTFGWGDLPTANVPQRLAGDWEMIPEDER